MTFLKDLVSIMILLSGLRTASSGSISIPGGSRPLGVSDAAARGSRPALLQEEDIDMSEDPTDLPGGVEFGRDNGAKAGPAARKPVPTKLPAHVAAAMASLRDEERPSLLRKVVYNDNIWAAVSFLVGYSVVTYTSKALGLPSLI